MISLTTIQAERAKLMTQLAAKPSGQAWCSAHSDLADKILRDIYDEVLAEKTNPPRIAVVATGGYGRRELSPWSDLDLAVIPLDDTHPVLDGVIKSLFSQIQGLCGEGLGLKVGYSFRPLADLPGIDAPTRTALLDACLVAGSSEVFQALEERFWQDFPAADFIIAKIRERNASMARWHDTPLVTQPNLKEGAGGLRSFQAANWIGMALGERPARPPAEYERVLRARNILHLVAKRSQDVLSIERRSAVASALGQQPSDFASDLSRSLLALDEIWKSGLERIPEARFRLTENVYAARGEVRIGQNATAGEAAIGVALGANLGIRPPNTAVKLEAGAKSAEALAVLGWGEKMLRAIDQAGILESLLPELTDCRHLMPRDGSHTYSVFEHTLRTISLLEGLPSGTYLGDLKAEQRDLSLLHLALLLHDVGKSDLTREHSIAGEEMARKVCIRWGLSNSETDLVAWLVREHLAMAKFIRMRDVQNPASVHEFADFVQTETRLTLLTLLTWADVNAVSSEAWTTIQQAYLEHLHRSARQVISEKTPLPDPAEMRRRLQRHLQKAPVDREDLELFLKAMPAAYVFSTPPEGVADHWQMLQLVNTEQAVVKTKDQRDLGVTEFTICCADKPGLLSQILAVFYAHDLRLHSVRASTSTGSTPVAVDVVNASYGSRMVPPQVAANISADLVGVIRGDRDPDELLIATGKDPDRPQQIFNWSWQAGNPGILEIQAPRGRGMAYRLSKLIAKQNWDIEGARLAQWAGKGAASFTISVGDGSAIQFEEVAGVLASKPSPSAQV